ncbi:hypothetical protein NQ315_014793 [Exocentrus adspersus]|uniref:CCHC-type domain-containing protein n=1 Tax=Exocentrus adspersus TaxID=1586481 RepID=A0AAV8VM83_9CUCU|nr:hypothetical protein NQ315_014793 [Exocentrus adspersus]
MAEGGPSENLEERVLTESEFEEFQRQHQEVPNENTNNGSMSMDNMLQTVNALVQQNAMMLKLLTDQGSIKNYNSMPDFSKTVADFNGDVRKSKEWLKSLESAATLHNWPDTFILETARMHLKGAAESWYKSRIDTLNNWRCFKVAFTKSFIHDDSRTVKWQEMVKRVQLPKEAVGDYFHDKVRLCKRLDLGTEEIKEQVAIGLISSKCADKIMNNYYSDEDDMFKDILIFERVNLERHTRMKKYNNKHVETFREQNSETRASDCPKPKRAPGSCFNCGSMEHQRRDCPRGRQKKPAAPAQDRSTNLVEVQMDPVPSYRIDVDLEINDSKISVQPILDTGSPISLIISNVVPESLIETANVEILYLIRILNLALAKMLL